MNARTVGITVRQLLTQNAGYTRVQVDTIESDRQLVLQLLKPGPTNPPGAEFEYQDGAPHLLSAVIAQATHQTTLDYARRVPFEPLDIPTAARLRRLALSISTRAKVEKIKTFGWPRDHEGIHCGSFGLELSTVRLIYTVLRVVLDTAVRDGVGQRNVAAAVKRPTVKRKDARI